MRRARISRASAPILVRVSNARSGADATAGVTAADSVDAEDARTDALIVRIAEEIVTAVEIAARIGALIGVEIAAEIGVADVLSGAAAMARIVDITAGTLHRGGLS
jgi:hypothetical protein